MLSDEWTCGEGRSSRRFTILHSSFATQHSCRRRAGITLLELLIVLAIAGIIAFIALPTLNPNEAEAQIEFAKEQLGYLHRTEQAYFKLHGTYAPLATLGDDATIGVDFDPRFKGDKPTVNGVQFIGPPGEGPTYEIVAVLPDNTRYRVDQTGEIVAMN